MNTTVATSAFDPAVVATQNRDQAALTAKARATDSGVGSLGAHKMSMKQMRKVAQDFEAVFLGEMLRPMFDGTQPDGPFGGGPGEDTYRSLELNEFGKAIAKRGGIGIADAVVSHMIQMQEANANSGAQQTPKAAYLKAKAN